MSLEWVAEYSGIRNQIHGSVKTIWQMKQVVAETTLQTDFDVESNSEFRGEGVAIENFMRPDRIVMQVQDERGAQVMAEVYRPRFASAPVPVSRF